VWGGWTLGSGGGRGQCRCLALGAAWLRVVVVGRGRLWRAVAWLAGASARTCGLYGEVVLASRR
jgi:hypothetical protein